MEDHRSTQHDDTKIYLIGGGIASLAAAAFLIRDADIPGHNIVILEQLDRLGGSLDGAGSPQDGYVLRGGRMIESKYLCTYDLFSSIPTLDGSKTVTQEIFDWNETMKTSSKSRLVRRGQRIDGPEFGLSEKHILNLERVVAEPEGMLGRSTIADEFDSSFFQTNFWLMWCTTFAFQPWHSAVEFRRYLLRFTHMVAGFNHLKGIMRTVLNQYDSMVRPLQKWLEERGVRFELNTRVTDLVLSEEADRKTVERIVYTRNGLSGEVEVGKNDFVIVTLGSMTEASSLGSMDSAPVLNGQNRRWRLDALGKACCWQARIRPPIGLCRSHRRIKMGVVHHHSARPDLLSFGSGPHGQRARRGRTDHLRGFQLVDLDRTAASAALYRTTRRRERLLGVRPVCR
jgi:oleate hydratase